MPNGNHLKVPVLLKVYNRFPGKNSTKEVFLNPYLTIQQKELSSLNITAGRYAMPVSAGLVI